jgi:AcrR family transcriptional regulator
MRDIASACGIKAPSLYNHFADKQSLYEATLVFVFAGHGDQLMSCLQQPLPAEQRLSTFIETLCQQLSDDFVFRQLFLREVIEQNAERAQFLAEQVMAAPCHALHDVFLSINANCDPHFLTTSLMGLTLFHFQINPLRPLLPGGSVEKQQLSYLTQHISLMIQAMLKS